SSHGGQMGRVNALVSEPSDAPQSANRFFVLDQNGMVYILDKASKKFTSYIDFRTAFRKFSNYGYDGGFGAGLVSITFDPGYARNGKFYTTHTEQPGIAGEPGMSDNLLHVDLKGFSTTEVVNPPVGNEIRYQSVLM